jgi:hypothetical protein
MRPQLPRLGLAVAVAVAAAVLAGVNFASADAARQRMEISYEINSDGRGAVVANISPDAAGRYGWLRCPPRRGHCEQLATHARALNAGNAPVGTTWIAIGTHGSQTSSAGTLPYRGRVRARTRPRVKGPVRSGAFVRPVAAKWRGGWGNEFDWLQLQVCRTRSGKGCAVISDSFYANVCPGTGAVIDGGYAGWFLRALDARIGRNTAIPTVAILPGHVPPFRPGPDVASSVPVRVSAQMTAPSLACST